MAECKFLSINIQEYLLDNMFKRKAIITTTHLGRDNIKIAKKALEEEVKRLKEFKMPINVNHDRRQLIGYTSNPELVKLEDGEYGIQVTCNLFETNEELEEYLESLGEPKVDSGFLEFNDGKKIKAEKYEDLYCDVYYGNNILKDIFPFIGEYLDEDGLFQIKDSKNINNFGIKVGNYYIIYHHWLRRYHSRKNNFNVDLIKNLIDVLKKYDGIKVKISVDLNMVGIVGTERNYMERDFWYGPKFIRKDISKIPDGVAVHGIRNESGKFRQIYKTDFFWHTKNNVKTLEIEELVDKAYPIDLDVEKGYPAKYVHTEFDLDAKKFVHLDGAIRIYNENNWEKRKTIDINKFTGVADRIKLFRVDHELEFEDWLKLVHFFFRSNEHIIEYFSS